MPRLPPSTNTLLAALSSAELTRLRRDLRPVVLETRQRLEVANEPITDIYFVESGIVSVVAIGAGGHGSEIGLVGTEGMTGTAIVLGNHRSTSSAFVQVAGRGQRIKRPALRRALRDSAPLRQLCLKYVQVFVAQTAHTAFANGRARLDQRLARWILMAHDRTEGDILPLTHEFLSVMLCVRRAGVTVALNALKRDGLIRSGRGYVELLDRTGLERRANGYYGVPESEYLRLIG